MLLATREIVRSKVRFGLLSGAVGLLVFLILFQQALLGGLITSFIGAVDNQDSPVLVFNDQARRNVEGSFLLPDQIEAIGQVDGVAASAPLGEATYTVEAGGELVDGVLFGYPVDGDGDDTLGAPTSLIEGRLPERPGEAVASAADADDGFDVGDVIRIAADGGPEIEVVGLGEDLRWSVAPTLFVDYSTFEDAQRAANPQADVVFPSLVVAFFFLILTVQKAKALTLLRAIGAPSSYLVRNLVVQIVGVMAAGIAVGIGLVLAVASATAGGAIEVELVPGTVLPTVAGLTVLALIGGLGAIRRVLGIDPIRATANTGAELS